MGDFWSWNNVVDAQGTLLSSPQGSAGKLLVSNLRDPRVRKIWRAGATAATLNVQFPTSGGVCMVGLFGVNSAALGTMTLRLGTSAGSGDLWEETFEPSEVGDQIVFVLRDGNGDPAPLEASHATVSVAAGAPLEIGRLWIGGADWHSSAGHSVDGSEWGAVDMSIKSLSRSGAVLGDRGPVLRTFVANYQILRESEYAGALFRMDARGTLQQMLFAPDPSVYEPHRWAILGTLSEIPSTSWRAHLTAGRSIAIQEAG